MKNIKPIFALALITTSLALTTLSGCISVKRETAPETTTTSTTRESVYTPAAATTTVQRTTY